MDACGWGSLLAVLLCASCPCSGSCLPVPAWASPSHFLPELAKLHCAPVFSLPLTWPEQPGEAGAGVMESSSPVSRKPIADLSGAPSCLWSCTGHLKGTTREFWPWEGGLSQGEESHEVWVLRQLFLQLIPFWSWLSLKWMQFCLLCSIGLWVHYAKQRIFTKNCLNFSLCTRHPGGEQEPCLALVFWDMYSIHRTSKKTWWYLCNQVLTGHALWVLTKASSRLQTWCSVKIVLASLHFADKETAHIPCPRLHSWQILATYPAAPSWSPWQAPLLVIYMFRTAWVVEARIQL
jgi:hypothetical protein